jgi:hypothetical protein
MAKKPAFQVTVSLNDSELTELAQGAIGYMYDDYEQDIFKAAGVDYKELINAVKVDPKFLKNVTKIVQEQVEYRLDAICDDLGVYDKLPVVNKALAALEKAFYKKWESTQAERVAAQRIMAARNLLEGEGYTVTK